MEHGKQNPRAWFHHRIHEVTVSVLQSKDLVILNISIYGLSNRKAFYHLRAGQHLSVVTIPESHVWLWNHLLHWDMLTCESRCTCEPWRRVHHAAGGTSALPRGEKFFFPSLPLLFTRIIFSHSLSRDIVILHVISLITDMHTQVYSLGWVVHPTYDWSMMNRIRSKWHHPIWVIPLKSSPEVMLESTPNLWLEKKEREPALAPCYRMLAALHLWDGRRLFYICRTLQWNQWNCSTSNWSFTDLNLIM